MYITFYGGGALFWPPPVFLYLNLEIREYERERTKERERMKKREKGREKDMYSSTCCCTKS